MDRTSEISRRLIRASREDVYDVYRRFEWKERLDDDRWGMPPELVSLYGTDVWPSLSDDQRRRLSVLETANLFANTLHGEQFLVSGLSERLYRGTHTKEEMTDYLHHFLDEENKHMVMFGLFCRKYAGRVYPDRSLELSKRYAPGEEEIAFYVMAMIIEDYGDHYNVRTMLDDRCDSLVREISEQHHADESRHLAFDRAYLTELAARWVPRWDEAQLASFRAWVHAFEQATWSPYYNPSVYRDAGIPEPYEVRTLALAHPAQVAHRARVSAKLDRFFAKIGLLETDEARKVA
jgi:hypothetical protein